jgi:hypothetical protein
VTRTAIETWSVGSRVACARNQRTKQKGQRAGRCGRGRGSNQFCLRDYSKDPCACPCCATRFRDQSRFGSNHHRNVRHRLLIKTSRSTRHSPSFPSTVSPLFSSFPPSPLFIFLCIFPSFTFSSHDTYSQTHSSHYLTLPFVPLRVRLKLSDLFDSENKQQESPLPFANASHRINHEKFS